MEKFLYAVRLLNMTVIQLNIWNPETRRLEVHDFRDLTTDN